MEENKEQTVPFGLHLMLDMYDCDPNTLGSKDIVYSILNDLPAKIGMKKLMDPVILWADSNDKKDPGGWSGFVMIQESHIALHTFIKRKFVTIDVYSCKEFDTDIAVKHFEELFKTSNFESIVEVRGKKYPNENLV